MAETCGDQFEAQDSATELDISIAEYVHDPDMQIAVERSVVVLNPIDSRLLRKRYGLDGQLPMDDDAIVGSEYMKRYEVLRHLDKAEYNAAAVIPLIARNEFDFRVWQRRKGRARHVLGFMALAGMDIPDDANLDELRSVARTALDNSQVLPVDVKHMLSDYYGLEDGVPLPASYLAKERGVTGNNIFQVTKRALGKLSIESRRIRESPLGSLHEPTSELDDRSLARLTIEEWFTDDSLAVTIERGLAVISAQQAEICKMRFGYGGQAAKDSLDIGRELNLSPANVRQQVYLAKRLLLTILPAIAAGRFDYAANEEIDKRQRSATGYLAKVGMKIPGAARLDELWMMAESHFRSMTILSESERLAVGKFYGFKDFDGQDEAGEIAEVDKRTRDISLQQAASAFQKMAAARAQQYTPDGLDDNSESMATMLNRKWEYDELVAMLQELERQPRLEKPLKNSHSDPRVRDFLLQAVRIPLLRAEQEVGLAQLIEVGKHAQARIDAAKSMSVALHPVLRGQFAAAVRHGELARKYFVEANLLLAADRAMRYQGRGMELGDLIQEASIGLIRAVENFDYTLGYKFSTYATIVINSLILSGIANKARLIRLPVHIQTGSLHELAVARLHLSSESSHEPTVKEIAKYMGKDEETVEQLISYSRQPISLSLTDDDESDRTVEDYLASHDVGSDPQAAVNSMANADILRQAIAKLPALERYVIVREFGLLGNDAECLESISERTGRKLRVLKDAELRAIDQLKSDGVISHLLAD